jgi:segregation and condensation protein B
MTMPETPVEPSPDDQAATAVVDITDPPSLRQILEAILLVVEDPVPETDLAQVVETDRHEVRRALVGLRDDYAAARRGFELREVAGGWRLYTSEACAPYVERYIHDGAATRLTQAALETLAVIAYRQPVSRSAIAGVRGVNVDAVVRTLMTRGLVAQVGEEGGAALLATTPYFLERLGLAGLAELPPLAPLLPEAADLETDLEPDSPETA